MEIPGDFVIPKIPEHLILPIMMCHSAQENTKEDLFENITNSGAGAGTGTGDEHLESISFRREEERKYDEKEVSREKEKEKEKFYIDETNMIERRFLPQDTRTFENVRTVDLFASSYLCETAVDCLRNVMNVDSLISDVMRQHFLKGRVDDVETRWFPLLWENHTPPLKKRDSGMEEWGITQEQAYRFVLNGPSHMAVLSLAISLGIAVVLEGIDHTLNVVGLSPASTDEMIVWIKQVPDGFLGVKLTVKDAEKRFRDTPELKILKDSPKRNTVSFIRTSSLKVTELKEKLKAMGGTPGKLKKAELIEAILEKSLWGMIE
jgi:hypothetical protein